MESNIVHVRKNTLQREGISPLSSGSSDNRGFSSNRYLFRHRKDIRIQNRTTALPNDFMNKLQRKEQWISIGGGWFDASASNSGEAKHCGLHSVLECHLEMYLLMYEAQTIPGYLCTTNTSPHYDLKVSVKIPKSLNGGVAVVFGYKSCDDFSVLIVDVDNKLWEIGTVTGDQYILLFEHRDPSLKENVFYGLHLQFRGDSVSVDVNGSALCTALRIPTAEDPGNSEQRVGSLSGHVGLLLVGAGSRCMMKDWRLTGRTSAVSWERAASPPVVMETAALPPAASNPLRPKSLSDLLSRRPSNVQVPSEEGRDRQSEASPPRAVERVGPPPKAYGGGGPRSSSGGAREKSPALSSSVPPATSTVQVQERVRVHLTGRGYESAMIDAIVRDLIDPTNITTKFEDIAALSDAKQVLNEVIVLPMLLPHVFTGILKPWKGILLFGPPGTGKTMLAKAVARSSGCTFWNCSAATIVSKYRGDSEKTIRCLFDAARAAAPSIVFIDEIDGIARGRNSASGADGEHEASRRLKIELLVQMDGLLEEQPILHTTLPGVAERTASQRVLVLGASNCPWDLDDALLRRFEKRIFIPLPAKDARKDIFMLYLAQMQLENNMDVPGAEYNAVLLHSLRSSWAERLAEHTEGYSGSDIACVCKEAAMGPVRRMMTNLAAGALPPQQWNPSTITLSPVSRSDFQTALENIKPSVSNLMATTARYQEWDNKCGCR